MAIKHIVGTEDVPQLKNQIDDDNGSWWGGVQLAGAYVVVAAGLLASAALTTQTAQTVADSHQDDPAGSLVNLKVEEDYWQYRLPSKTDYFVAAQYDTPEAVVQPTFAPDEDAWQSPVPQAQVIQSQPWAFAQDEVVQAVNAFDEDYWQSNVRPVLMTFAQMAPWAWDDATITQLPAAGPAALGRSVRLGIAFPAFR